jgi:hypothetical protein
VGARFAKVVADEMGSQQSMIGANRKYLDRAFASVWDDLVVIGGSGLSGLMMFATVEKSGVHDQERWDIYIRLPSRELLKLFPGFVEIEAAELPRNATTLYGDPGEFERLFIK